MAKKALCIGINDYPGTQMDLQGCVNDARDWAAVLGGRSYSVACLLDEQATRNAIMESIRDLVSAAAPGDRIVITYSGHGTYQPDLDGDEADGLDEALCPYDIQTAGRALLDDEIRELFQARPPGIRLLLISDSCHSGTVNRAPAEADADAPRPRFLPMDHWLPADRIPPTRSGVPLSSMPVSPGRSPFTGALRKDAGDLLLSGCQEGPNNFSYDAKIGDRYNGAFTYYALKTLNALAPDASYAEWHRKIAEYLPSTSYPQSPQIVGHAAARRRKVFA